MRIFRFICLIAGFLGACSKLETDPPSVSIAAPVAGDTLYLSDSIHLRASIQDKHLTYYKVIVYNYYSRKLLYKEEGNTAAGTYELDKNITFELNADTAAYLNILGIDQNGNTGNAGLKFYLKK